jgi:hypothetical protein
VDRAEKFARKHGLLIQDTIMIIDTVIIQNYKRDTLTQFIVNDSITVINNEKVSLRYFYDTLTREIYHEIECKGDTLIEKHVITTDRIKVVESKKDWITWVLLGGCLFIFLILIRILRKN